VKLEKDDQLWQQAKARAGFKIHFIIYVFIMTILWIMWLISGGVNHHPWPIYPTLGWGIGIVFNYFEVYKFSNAAEKEYEKLKRNEPNTVV
jgi:hypothetical protein